MALWPGDCVLQCLLFLVVSFHLKLVLCGSPTMPVVQVSNVFILDPVRRSCSCDALPSHSQSDTYPDAIQVKSNMCTNTEIQQGNCEIQIQKNGQAGQAEGSPHRRDVCSPCNLITNGSMFPPLLHQHHKYKYKYSWNKSSPTYFIAFYANIPLQFAPDIIWTQLLYFYIRFDWWFLLL